MTAGWRLALLATLLITACSQQTGQPIARTTATTSASVSPSQSVSPSPSAEASQEASPGAPITAIPDLPITTLGFSCRLPVYQLGGGIWDGFISFPSTATTTDSSGNNGKYFDRAYSRWLPVDRWSVSPDGSHYASVETVGQSAGNEFVLHVVEVSSGKELLFNLSPQLFNGQPSLLDYSADGIYLINGFEHLLAGLWLVDPSTGSIRQVSKDLYPVYSAGNGIIWAQASNPNDPKPVVTGSSIGTLPDEIDWVDLRSGAEKEWLYEPGKGLSIVGLDSRGFPLIVETGAWGADPNARLLLVVGADAPTQIYKGAIVQEIGGGITDAHGTWLGGQRGIYLYTNPGYLVKVSDHPAYAFLANGCF